jgi:hypothetical protein
MTDPTLPKNPADREQDHRFDAALGALLRAEAEDISPLAAAVMARLSAHSAPHRSRAWLSPAPLAAGFGGLMAAAAALGYIGLPLFGTAGDDIVLTAALGGLMAGGF